MTQNVPKPEVRPTGPAAIAAKDAPSNVPQPGRPGTHGGIQFCKSVKFPLARAPMPMARRFLQIVTAIWVEACGPEGLSNLEFGALGALLREPDIDQIGLAARIGVDRTNVGLIIDSLEKRGFVERQVNPKDRRARLMRVTPAGETDFQRQARQTAFAREKVLSPLTPAERETLYDLLERVIAANEQYSIPGAGRRKRGG